MAAMRVDALLGAEPAAGQRRRHSPRAFASPSALQQRGLGVLSLGAPAGAGPASPPHPCPAVPVRCSLQSKAPPPTTLAAAAAALARAAAAALARVPAAAMAFAAPEEIPTARAAHPAVPRSGSSQRRHRVPQPDWCHTPPVISLEEPTAPRVKQNGRSVVAAGRHLETSVATQRWPLTSFFSAESFRLSAAIDAPTPPIRT